MNVIDRVIKAVDPEAALRRERARIQLDHIQNSGYSNYGASRQKKSLKGWISTGGSAVEDIHENLGTLRQRSRDLFMGVPLATGAIKTYRTNVIGSGLIPKPTLDAEWLRISKEQAGELEKRIMREFSLWADSTNADAERMSTFYQIQQLAFMNWLMSGDCFAILQMKKRKGCVYETCIQLIEADRVCNPDSDGSGNEYITDTKIVGGVEVDEAGEVVAYHIAQHHPLSIQHATKREWKRVPAFGRESGRRNVLHIMMKERIGQRRGVPILAPVIESLKQIGRYTDAELVAAVVNGLFSVFIESESATDALPIGEEIPEEEQVDRGDQNTIELGNGTVVDLAPGEKANSVTPGRPNANFEGFVSAVSKQIGAALELPYELLMKQFTASYSASRAALLEAWKSFSMWRDWMVESFCQPIYEEWLREAVAKGRISAPGFFSDPAIEKAYCNAQWYGPTQGQLDPVKEVTAAGLRIKYGFSNGSKEAMELTGTDYGENLRMIGIEREMRKEAGMDGEESEDQRSDMQQQRS